MRRAGIAAALIVAALLQAGTASALSLRESVELALQQDPRLLAAADDVRSSGSLADAARTEWLPRAQFDADYGRSDLETDALFPVSGARSPYHLSASITQPLYTSGLTTAHVAEADANAAASGDSRRDLASRIILATVTAYLDLVRDDSVVELSRSNLAALGQARTDTDKRLDAGEATRTDVAQAAARAAEADAQLRRALAQRAQTRATFLRLTGREPEALVADWPQPALPDTLAEALAGAVDAPGVLAQARQADAARARLAGAKAQGGPRLSLDGSAARQDNTEFGFDPLDEYDVKLRLTVPIYEGGLRRAQVAAAEAQAEGADHRVEDARRAFAEETGQRWATLGAAQDVIASYQAQVEASKLALDGTRKELDVGTRTTLDLLDAERELLSAQVNLVGARRDRAVAAYALLDACGRLGVESVP